MSYNRLRAFLLIGWALTIACVVAAYAVALATPMIRPDPQALITNMAAIVGLLSPHLTLIYEFFFSNQPRSNRRLPAEVAYTIAAMCAFYWLVFVGCVWLGVVFRAFSSTGDGTGLDLTTSIVVAIAGTLSFLAIKPTTKLFILANEDATLSTDAPPTSPTRSAP